MTSTDRERQHDEETDRGAKPFEASEDRDEEELVAPADEIGAGADDDPHDVVARLTSERDQAVAAKQRAQADFANFQRRAGENEQRALVGGMSMVVRALLPALDNLDRALDTDPSRTTTEQLLDGVRMVRGEIARALESHGITAIVPKPGDEFDPRQHEALMRQAAEGIEPNHVVTALQIGYAMGETILRPAKVVISPAQ